MRRGKRSLRAWLLLIAAVCALTACGGAAKTQSFALPTAQTVLPSGMPRFHHVFTVVMENLSYKQALDTPDIHALAARYASGTQVYAAGHPSLPNYLALTSGSMHGIHSDCFFCTVSGPSIASQLASHHISWGAYMEGLPWAGYMLPFWPVPFVNYAGKHNPFRYYKKVRSSAALAGHVKPLTVLTKALKGPSSGVPQYVFVTPNLCHDGHNCSAIAAATWLSHFVDTVVSSAAYKDDGLLLIIWDEGAGQDTRGLTPDGTVQAHAGGGHMLLIVIARGIPAGEKVGQPLTTASLLKTEEEIFGLPLLGRAAKPSIPDLRSFFRPT